MTDKNVAQIRAFVSTQLENYSSWGKKKWEIPFTCTDIFPFFHDSESLQSQSHSKLEFVTDG